MAIPFRQRLTWEICPWIVCLVHLFSVGLIRREAVNRSQGTQGVRRMTKTSQNNAFEKFVKRQQATVPSFDAAKRRAWWLGRLAGLYKQIGSFLKPYVDSNQMRLGNTEIDLNEHLIGAYRAPRLTLTIGRQEVLFTPVGTMMIGCSGRVDVLGPGVPSRLVLVDKGTRSARSSIRVSVNIGSQLAPPPTPERQIEWAWKVASAPPEMAYVDLTQESLKLVIMRAADV